MDVKIAALTLAAFIKRTSGSILFIGTIFSTTGVPNVIVLSNRTASAFPICSKLMN